MIAMPCIYDRIITPNLSMLSTCRPLNKPTILGNDDIHLTHTYVIPLMPNLLFLTLSMPFMLFLPCPSPLSTTPPSLHTLAPSNLPASTLPSTRPLYTCLLVPFITIPVLLLPFTAQYLTLPLLLTLPLHPISPSLLYMTHCTHFICLPLLPITCPSHCPNYPSINHY